MCRDQCLLPLTQLNTCCCLPAHMKKVTEHALHIMCQLVADGQVYSAVSNPAAQAEAQPGGRYSVVTEFMLRLLVRRILRPAQHSSCPVAHGWTCGHTPGA